MTSTVASFTRRTSRPNNQARLALVKPVRGRTDLNPFAALAINSVTAARARPSTQAQDAKNLGSAEAT
jgi:hypothetical protein